MKYCTPTIEKKSWLICTPPDLGELAADDPAIHDIGDHSFYLDDDGVWHLWAAIRNAKIGHVICAWESPSLEGPWDCQGVVLRAKERYGENIKPNGKEHLSAPFFIQHDGQWNCFYNSKGVCRLRSEDGKTFKRVLNAEGSSFSHRGGRDVMILKIDDLYFAYSCVTTVSADDWAKSFMIVRTSPDLETWSDYTIVSEGGRAGNGPVSAESPFVVQRDEGFYLFRSSSIDFNTYVYFSDTPYNFGVNDDSKLITVLPLRAPEIIRHAGKEFISDLADFKGLRLAELTWEEGGWLPNE